MAPTSLVRWFTDHGRHDLPWRRTTDPWAVAVSELMLQQTSVARVREPWARFMRLWPTPQAMAGSDLADVLREWKGLGYPRRARALRECARHVATDGWGRTEEELRRLPGIGEYTARALLCFALGEPTAPPRDVNIARVAARAWIGAEAQGVRASALDAAIEKHRPHRMDQRSYVFALFDIGATLCTARAVRCDDCPLRRTCRSRRRLVDGVPSPPRRQPAYQGSFRQLRGAVLAAALDGCETPTALRRALDHLPQAREPGAIETALTSLRADRLLPA